MDDEKLAYPFYEKSKKLGLKVFSCHKGFASQSRTLGHFAHPGDVEKAAKDHPDLSFIVYHSAMKHGTWDPGFKDPKNFDPEKEGVEAYPSSPEVFFEPVTFLASQTAAGLTGQVIHNMGFGKTWP